MNAPRLRARGPASLAHAPLLFAGLLFAACSGGGGPSGPGDDDGDGLSNQTELDGWEIAVDSAGLGGDLGPQVLRVTSDPSRADTDGDGLNDGLEYQARSHPRMRDTDGDGLDDREEWFQWKSSPASADTDGDARGPNGNLPARAELFDGNEVHLLKTSPTLADTDGDGATDYEEYTSGGGNPLIAELPQFDLELAGELDVRLDVEYAESLGQSTEYGMSFGAEQTSTTSSSSSHTFQAGYAYSIGATVDPGVPPSASVSASHTISIGYEGTWTSTTEDAIAMQVEHSRAQTDSRDLTETASTGRVSTGAILRNGGDTTFTVDGLSSALLYSPPGTEDEFSVMATLELVAGGVTLAPGEESPVLQFEASEVNADVVKSFMALPDTLVIQPGVFSLQDSEGVDFEFLTENAYARTATLEINYGGGMFDVYQVATNVRRDAAGNLTGITLAEALEIAGLPAGDSVNGYLVVDQYEDEQPTGKRVLQSIRGRAFNPGAERVSAYWFVNGSRDEHEDVDDVESIRLVAGDRLTLLYSEDRDEDGVSRIQEQEYGTDDDDLDGDTDDDGISDDDEINGGWTVPGEIDLDGDEEVDINLTEFGYPRKVVSDPRRKDTDEDGLDDLAEKECMTDPMHPDTDRDGLLDGEDPEPLIPALVLHVDVDAAGDDEDCEPGDCWANAFVSLEDALSEAEARNTDMDNRNDVSQIWVARGSYSPDTSEDSFVLVDQVSVFGGFEGGELKLGQRNPDPLFGGALLDGDIDNNDTQSGTLGMSTANNVIELVRVPAGSTCRLDGFALQGARDHAVLSEAGATARLANLLVRRNRGTVRIEGLPGPEGQRSEIADSIFTENQPGAAVDSEAVAWLTDCDVRDCEFAFNFGDALEVERCAVERTRFEQNLGTATAFRPADAMDPSNSASFLDCEWRDNGDQDKAVGGLRASGGTAVVVNGLFHRNVGQDAGAVLNGSGPDWLVNCTLVGNRALKSVKAYWLPGAPAPFPNEGNRYRISTPNLLGPTALTSGGVRAVASVWMDNCILFGNTRRMDLEDPTPDTVATLPNVEVADELAQVASGEGLMTSLFVSGWGEIPDGFIGFQPTVTGRIRTSFLGGLLQHGGAGNLGGIEMSPGLVGPMIGNLRLGPDSVCIDAGNRFVDTDPLTPGLQPLPPFDLDGAVRVIDGTGAGQPQVDMGAYEVQPQ